MTLFSTFCSCVHLGEAVFIQLLSFFMFQVILKALKRSFTHFPLIFLPCLQGKTQRAVIAVIDMDHKIVIWSNFSKLTPDSSTLPFLYFYLIREG